MGEVKFIFAVREKINTLVLYLTFFFVCGSTTEFFSPT